MLKVIKTQDEYEEAVREAEQLARLDPSPDTDEGNRLELLAFLISTFEDDHFPIKKPSPLEAIRFRMEQQGLTQRDLVPYIGSRSKVSEVLNGKRRLTLRMIRSLNKELDIPAEILLQESNTVIDDNSIPIECDKFPVPEMAKRQWFSGFQGKPKDAKDIAEELLTGIFERAGIVSFENAYLRQHVRSGSEMNPYALVAWWARVMELAKTQKLLGPYKHGAINKSFLSNLVKLSIFNDGPKLAGEYLLRHGIHFVVLSHLPRTHIDGAALLLDDGTPVVALTLRYDRLDNFWFCLFHELAHVSKHLGPSSEEERFFDNLDVKGGSIESEADIFAEEALIPPKRWIDASVRTNFSSNMVRHFSQQNKVHPAIVAGRIRREQSNYRILWSLVGKNQVRNHFPGHEAGVS